MIKLEKKLSKAEQASKFIQSLNAKAAKLKADGLADYFYRIGITGYPEEAGSCPVSEYVKQTFPGVTCSVTPLSIRVWDRRALLAHETVNGDLANFVCSFDLRKYPNLIGPDV